MLKGIVSSITMGKFLGNPVLLKNLVDKAQAKGYKVVVEVKSTGKAIISLQGSTQHNSTTKSSPLPHTLSAFRMYRARSGPEGMEWLLRRLF